MRNRVHVYVFDSDSDRCVLRYDCNDDRETDGIDDESRLKLTVDFNVLSSFDLTQVRQQVPGG